MARRPVFAADTPAATLREYVFSAAAEPFHTPRVLPLMQRVSADPEPALPVLFAELPERRKGEPPSVAAASSRTEMNYHAMELATVEGWQQLVASMDRTTPEIVAGIVGHRVGNGRLPARIGRALLEACGIPEPSDRSEGELLGMSIAFWKGPRDWLSGWGAVHGKEDGWIQRKVWYGAPICVCTPYGLKRLGIELPPAPRPPEKRGTPPPGMPLDQVMQRLFNGVIPPPSPLALKRRRLKTERAAARGSPQI